jgi:hypothetical protein
LTRRTRIKPHDSEIYSGLPHGRKTDTDFRGFRVMELPV